MRRATPRTAASSSGRRTAPCTSMRSGTVKRSSRGTSGRDLTMLMSYWSKRPSSAISITSRKPSVAMSAVRAPLRSMMALVASVVPCTNTPMSPNVRPASASALRAPSMTATSGSRGVVSSLATCRRPPLSSTMSVNVPPMSTASRAARRFSLMIVVRLFGSAPIRPQPPRPPQGGDGVARSHRHWGPGRTQSDPEPTGA